MVAQLICYPKSIIEEIKVANVVVEFEEKFKSPKVPTPVGTNDMNFSHLAKKVLNKPETRNPRLKTLEM